MEVDVALDRPLAASQLRQDVDADAAADKRLFGFVLLADFPELASGFGAEFRRCQRVGIVGNALPRYGRRARRRSRRLPCRGQFVDVGKCLRQIDVTFAAFAGTERTRRRT
jgi:hypothetical protein